VGIPPPRFQNSYKALDANVSGEEEMMMGMQIWMGNGRIMMGDANLDWGIPMGMQNGE